MKNIFKLEYNQQAFILEFCTARL